MKVLHFKSNFLNYSETFIKRLVNNHQDFSPVAMCIHKRDYTDLCPLSEMPCKGIAGLVNNACFHLNWCLPFYIDTLKKEQPQIIHAHFGFDGYRMIKPSKRTTIPLVVSFYGSDVSRLPLEFDWKRRYRKLAEHGHAFISASELMKNQLIDLGFPEQKISVVRFGLDLQEFSFNSTAYNPQYPMMMVGRMVEKKGFLHALKAIAILKKKHKLSVPCDIYGDGPLLNELIKRSNEWGIDHLITFHGYTPITKVREAYHAHSLLLVPSVTASDGDQEGVPNTILEGMASGIPVISTRHSAIQEVLKHKKNGLLIDEGDAEALADMIIATNDEKLDLSSIRENARTHICKYYNIHDMASQIENIYKTVINA